MRHDNADLRLRDYGYNIGLISETKYQEFLNKKEQISNLTEYLKNTKITPKEEINKYLVSIPTSPLRWYKFVRIIKKTRNIN